MIVRFGCVAAASITAYVVNQLNQRAKESPAPLNKPAEIGEASFELQNQMKDKQQSADSDHNLKEKNQIYEAEMEDDARELESLRIKELQEREVKPEGELPEYYGLKEQESDIVELQRQLKIKTVEIEMLNITISSLQSETKKLQEEIALSSNVRKELEEALNNINKLERQVDAKLNKQSRNWIPFSSCFKRAKVARFKVCCEE